MNKKLSIGKSNYFFKNIQKHSIKVNLYFSMLKHTLSVSKITRQFGSIIYIIINSS